MKKSLTLFATLSSGFATDLSFNLRLSDTDEPQVGDSNDADRSFAEICTRAGFDFEEHNVVTEDGYVLSVYRIPGVLAGD